MGVVLSVDGPDFDRIAMVERLYESRVAEHPQPTNDVLSHSTTRALVRHETFPCV